MADKYIRAGKKRMYKTLIPTFSANMNLNKDQRLLQPAQASFVLNLDTANGVLTTSWGVTDFSLAAKKVWQYLRTNPMTGERENILMHSSITGDVYHRFPGATVSSKLGIKVTSPPLAVNYRLYGEDVILLCSQTDHMIVWNGDGDAYTVPSSPFVTSLCIHYERMFATVAGQENAVWFSDDLDPTNWNPELDEGGFIELRDERGRCNRVVSFNNYVYVFRDYGITRLSAYADQSDFSATNLFVSSRRIFSDTVAVCGDVILFMAEDGFYSFDGLSTRRILTEIDNAILPGTSPIACYSLGRYWACFRLDSAPVGLKVATYNSCLLSYDRHKGDFSISYEVALSQLCPVLGDDGETLYCVSNKFKVGTVEKTGMFMTAVLVRIWKSGLMDMNLPDKTKLLTEFCVDSVSPFTLTVFNEKTSKTFLIPGGGLCKKRIQMAGKQLGFTIKSYDRTFEVARPVFTYKVLD